MKLLKITILVGMLLLSCLAAWLVYLVAQTTHTPAPATEARTSMNSLTNHDRYDSLDEAAARSDVVVRGKVRQVDAYDSVTEEYQLEIKETFKGEVKTGEVIHVYETGGTLIAEENYVLFLERSIGGYFPHPTYTSGSKDFILHIAANDKVLQQSTSSEVAGDWKSLREDLQTTQGMNFPREGAPLERAAVRTDDVPLRTLATEAEVVARIEGVEVLWENKYHRAVTLKLHEVYLDNSGQDVLNNADVQYILPASMELGVEYLAFLSFMDGYFFTVSQDNSLVPVDDSKAWNEAIELTERLRSS